MRDGGLESLLIVVGLAVAAGGCGSGAAQSDAGVSGGAGAGGAGGGAGGCVAEAPAGGVTSWVDDGVRRCALIIDATRTTGTTADTLHLVAIDPGNVGVTLAVSSYGAALGAYTYRCQPDGGVAVADGGASEYVSLQYVGGGAMYETQDCTITVTAPGTPGKNARGTFSATLSALGGGSTKVISSGVFDTSLTASGG